MDPDAASRGHPHPADDTDDDLSATTTCRDSASVNSAESLPYSKWRCIALVATVTGASFQNTFSVQAVVIILPAIGRDLAVPDARLQWIF